MGELNLNGFDSHKGNVQNPVDQKQKQGVKLMKSLAPPLMATFLALSPFFIPPGNNKLKHLNLFTE